MPNFMEIVQAVKKLNSILRERLNFRRWPILCTTLYRNLYKRATSPLTSTTPQTNSNALLTPTKRNSKGRSPSLLMLSPSTQTSTTTKRLRLPYNTPTSTTCIHTDSKHATSTNYSTSYLTTTSSPTETLPTDKSVVWQWAIV